MKLPRLDILIYAHDGRGLGHASRGITIGMALRRLYPRLRVLFVSGCRVSQELIGPTPLDWLKLPSYETEVVAGKSRGIPGNSLFSDGELGELRAAQLQQIVTLYRPRLILSDHTPQGKHRELIPALRATEAGDIRWVLGVRGVLGTVSQAQSQLAGDLFREHYQALLWYGDSHILGDGHRRQLQEQYGIEPAECGYVSRLRELYHLQGNRQVSGKKYAGTIAVPWIGEKSVSFLRVLARALQVLGPAHGRWRIFLDMGSTESISIEIRKLFAQLSHCQLEPPSGARYVEALLASRSAVVYGGYNSLMDVLALNLPAVVVLREMQDNEQQLHLQKIGRAAGELLQVVEESGAEVGQLTASLLGNLGKGNLPPHTIFLAGAENAARRLWQLLPGQADG